MARVALNALVRRKSGEVTTIAALAGQGLITFTMSNNFAGSAKATPRKAYFAEMPDGGCWEISKTAYESRMGLPITLKLESPA